MAKFELDGHKLLYHPQALVDFLSGKNIKPIYAEISPSANCNHGCIFCHYEYLGHKGMFKQGRMKTLIDELKDSGIKSMVFAGTGEPLINQETVPSIAYAKEKGIDVALSTNGALLKEDDLGILAKSLTWIRFSFNSGNAENYAKVHKAKKEDYSLVLNNIQKLRVKKNELNADITIGIQYIILDDNKDFVVDCAKTMKKAGVDYFVVKYFYGHSKNQSGLNNDWLTDDFIKSLSRSAESLSDESFSFIVRSRSNISKDRFYKECYGLPFIIYIREDGEVYTCFSYQHDKKTSLGNIFEKSFSQVWSKRRKTIDYINKTYDKKMCQPNCRHHQINSFLWELKHPEVEHVNFI